MDPIKKGEVLVLEDNREYICIDDTEYNDENYVYLLTTSHPLIFNVYKVLSDNSLEEVTDIAVKDVLFERLQSSDNN